MNSADKIKQFFKDAELSINSDADEKIFQDVFDARQKAKEKAPAKPVNIGRIIMKNSITKFAAAAVVIIAGAIGLTMFNKTANVALGEVLEHIKEVNAFIYQIKSTSTTKMETGMVTDSESNQTIWISQEFGMRMDQEMSFSFDPTGQKTVSHNYLLPKQNAMMTIIPDMKRFVIMDINDTQAFEMRRNGYDPQIMIEQLLESGCTEFGRSTIDGVEVEGFQTNDPEILGTIGLNHVDIILWVDVKTQLPFQMELDYQMEMDIQTTGQMDISVHSVINNFQWNVQVDSSVFEPNIPDDYKPLTNTPLQLTYDENAAIEGLQLFADKSGKYPDELDYMKLITQISELVDFNETGLELTEGLEKTPENIQLVQEKITAFMLEAMTPIQGLALFYTQLVQEDKDPAYYGNITTPEDSDQVLMRWKVSDNEYRVIFGSLYAETVTEDVLIELEKKLPQ